MTCRLISLDPVRPLPKVGVGRIAGSAQDLAEARPEGEEKRLGKREACPSKGYILF